MRVLFLADRSFAEREQSMLRRLEVGLIAEGLHVVRAVPVNADCSGEGEPTGLDAMIRYMPRSFPLSRGSLARRLHRTILDHESLEGASDSTRSIDLIHVWGASVWAEALELAKLTGADLAFECWSRDSIRYIRDIERRARALDTAASRGVWLAPDETILAEVERISTFWPVRSSAWGVHVPPATVPSWEGAGPIAICVLSHGRDPLPCMNLLGALAAMTRAEEVHEGRHDREAIGQRRAAVAPPEALIFLDSKAVEDHPEIWKRAERLRLLDRLSLIEGMECRRSLVLQTHLLIEPESHAGHRSLRLDAMAHGMSVIARHDPLVGSLIDGRTSIVAATPSIEGWTTALRRVIESPAAAADLGRNARHYISEHRLAHRQVAAALDAYKLLQAKGVPSPIPIRSA